MHHRGCGTLAVAAIVVYVAVGGGPMLLLTGGSCRGRSRSEMVRVAGSVMFLSDTGGGGGTGSGTTR